MYSDIYRFANMKAAHPAKISEATLTTPPRSKQAISPTRFAEKPQQNVTAALAQDTDFQSKIQFLMHLGIGKPLIDKAVEKAHANGTDPEMELLASGQIEPDAYYEAVANILGVPFLSDISGEYIADSDVLDTQLVETTMVRINHPTSTPVVAICPLLHHLPAILERCESAPTFKQSIAVATPETIRKAVWKAGEARRLAATQNQLFDDQPLFSARTTLSGTQGFIAGLIFTALVTCFLLAPWSTFQVVHIFLSFLYLASLALRFLAVGPWQRRGEHTTTSDEKLPVYTVLVALYREEALIPQLVKALSRINWPKSRLDIKLVCEADDLPTIAAARKYARGGQFEIVEVPPSQPRTKPKALTYALAAARGEFIVIYDAEDRPHPEQLREAYARFSKDRDDLACLQAPLVIANGGNSWMTALFALEYSALFRTMLPMLSSFGLPIPLGGTSNHFRAHALKLAGGWDPYNVTEDADLGIRLSRLGWRLGTLTLPTLEDAPTDRAVWLSQRSRWFKGWMQTLLVHMRNPVSLIREIGSLRVIAFLGMSASMLFSALTHPILLTTTAITLAMLMLDGQHVLTGWQTTLLLMDCFNLAGTYAIFIALGRVEMSAIERRRVGKRWLATPLYWILLSRAVWRSIFELWKNPHFWNKTPHEPSSLHKGRSQPPINPP